MDVDHREALKRKLDKRKRRNLHLGLTDLTDFNDKVAIMSSLFELGQGFQAELGQIKELRNSLDHARDFIEGEDGVKTFLQRLGLADHWIEEFESPSSGSMKVYA